MFTLLLHHVKQPPYYIYTVYSAKPIDNNNILLLYFCIIPFSLFKIFCSANSANGVKLCKPATSKGFKNTNQCKRGVNRCKTYNPFHMNQNKKPIIIKKLLTCGYGRKTLKI